MSKKMSTILAVGGALAITLVLAGATLFGDLGRSDAALQGGNQRPPAAGLPAGGNAPWYSPVDPQAWPAAVREWIEGSSEAGYTVIEAGGKRYLVIRGGLRPTGGYEIEIISAVPGNEGTVIDARISPPAPGMMVIQILTNPSIVLLLGSDVRTVTVNLHE